MTSSATRRWAISLYEAPARITKAGNKILIDDSLIELDVVEVNETILSCSGVV